MALLGVCTLIAGDVIYGKLIERIFGIKLARPTSAIALNDGVDFVPLSTQKVYLALMLNSQSRF